MKETTDIVAVKIANLTKKYTIHHEKPTLIEKFLHSTNESFYALKKINLTIKKGERVGIIGSNGSGKTTLLKIISGIATPSQGSVYTSGKLVSLIDLDAGFHPDLTGEENIFINGLLVGMTKEEIKTKLKEIVAFSGINKFIDSPFYTYSEGMKLRLGFSILIHTNPEIILLDENIGVGDLKFREKSLQKINKEFFNKNKTVIIVSHQLSFIEKNCDKVIWINKGRIKEVGGTNIISKYQRN